MSIMEMSVEQFMDGMKAVMRENGMDDCEGVDAILVDAYNEYREKVRDGKSVEDLIPLFHRIANDVLGGVKKK